VSTIAKIEFGTQIEESYAFDPVKTTPCLYQIRILRSFLVGDRSEPLQKTQPSCSPNGFRIAEAPLDGGDGGDGGPRGLGWVGK